MQQCYGCLCSIDVHAGSILCVLCAVHAVLHRLSSPCITTVPNRMQCLTSDPFVIPSQTCRWQQFAPVPLQPPEAATLPQLELPEYVEPVLPTEPDMPPVVLVDIPDLGPPLQEVPLPEYK